MAKLPNNHSSSSNDESNKNKEQQQPVSRIAERYRRSDELAKETSSSSATNFNPKDQMAVSAPAQEMLFSNKNFMWFGIGIAIVVIGFLLMAGGQMPDANTFDESIIYSPLRVTVAPFLVLAGLGVIIYGIFKNEDSNEPSKPLF